jgi:hypothetical protein
MGRRGDNAVIDAALRRARIRPRQAKTEAPIGLAVRLLLVQRLGTDLSMVPAHNERTGAEVIHKSLSQRLRNHPKTRIMGL